MAGADVSVPASLDRTPGKCCGGTTDGDGNQASLLRPRRLPIVAFSRQPAKTKPPEAVAAFVRPPSLPESAETSGSGNLYSSRFWVFLDCTVLDKFTFRAARPKASPERGGAERSKAEGLQL